MRCLIYVVLSACLQIFVCLWTRTDNKHPCKAGTHAALSGIFPIKKWLHPGQIPHSWFWVCAKMYLQQIALHSNSNLLISVQASNEPTIAAEAGNNVWIEKVIWWELGQLFRSVYNIQFGGRFCKHLKFSTVNINCAQHAIVSQGWGTPQLWLVLQTRGSKVMLISVSAKLVSNTTVIHSYHQIKLSYWSSALSVRQLKCQHTQ